MIYRIFFELLFYCSPLLMWLASIAIVKVATHSKRYYFDTILMEPLSLSLSFFWKRVCLSFCTSLLFLYLQFLVFIGSKLAWLGLFHSLFPFYLSVIFSPLMFHFWLLLTVPLSLSFYFSLCLTFSIFSFIISLFLPPHLNVCIEFTKIRRKKALSHFVILL